MPEKKRKREYKGSTDSIRAAVKRYDSKLGHLRIRTTPEEKEKIEAAASAAGISLNQYVIEAVRDRMQRDRDAAHESHRNER